jgi:hypothetical protein
MHWQEIRGLETKYAGGSNIRWRVLVKPNIGIYMGIGAIYEYEKWNYSGVATSSAIRTTSDFVELTIFRAASFLSIKKHFGELFDLDFSLYYQPTIGSKTMSHRGASSAGLTYNISEYFGLTIIYQNIYDSHPAVPIDKLYHDVNLGITVSF